MIHEILLVSYIQTIRLRQRHELGQHGRVVGSAQAGDWVPAGRGVETRSSAPRVVANGDVVQDLGVLVESRVDEADSLLAGGNSLLVDAVDDCGEDGRSG